MFFYIFLYIELHAHILKWNKIGNISFFKEKEKKREEKKKS